MIFSTRDVEMVRAFVVAPAQVQPHSVGRDVAQRVVERVDVQRDALHEHFVGSSRYMM